MNEYALFGILCAALFGVLPQESLAAPSVGGLKTISESCDQVSDGLYAMKEGGPETVAICGLKGGFFWKADADIDCDGTSTVRCNSETDPTFQPQTSFVGSNGQFPKADTGPWVVLPVPDARFDSEAAGVRPGALTIAMYNGRAVCGTFADENAEGIIGEMSYAAAAALGINPDPRTGGLPTNAPNVTYFIFTGESAVVSPLEDPRAAVAKCDSYAAALIENNQVGAGPGACSLYQSGAAMPSGFGAPYSFFSATNNLLVRATCNQNNITVTLGASQLNQYVYSYGYYWDNGVWIRYDVEGPDPEGELWYVGQANADIPYISDVTYFVGYVCENVNNTWRCGCARRSCAWRYWQLQAALR